MHHDMGSMSYRDASQEDKREEPEPRALSGTDWTES